MHSAMFKSCLSYGKIILHGVGLANSAEQGLSRTGHNPGRLVCLFLLVLTEKHYIFISLDLPGIYTPTQLSEDFEGQNTDAFLFQTLLSLVKT